MDLGERKLPRTFLHRRRSTVAVRVVQTCSAQTAANRYDRIHQIISEIIVSSPDEDSGKFLPPYLMIGGESAGSPFSTIPSRIEGPWTVVISASPHRCRTKAHDVVYLTRISVTKFHVYNEKIERM